MGRKRIYEVVKHLPAEELDKRIKKLEKDTRVLKRLYFIRYLYRGMSVEEAASLVGVTKATGYAWLKRWNSRGYEGLIPEFGGGRPSKLTKIRRKNSEKCSRKEIPRQRKKFRNSLKLSSGLAILRGRSGEFSDLLE